MMINLAIKVFVFTIFFLALPRSWFEKDKRGLPWMLNMYLAFTNSCGLRPQGSRTLPDEWFTDAACYDNLSGRATVSREVEQYGNKAGQYVNRIKFWEQQKAPVQQQMNMNPDVNVTPFQGDSTPNVTDEITF